LKILTDRLGPNMSFAELQNTEFAKIDAVLSSRCLLFNRPKDSVHTDR